MHHRKKLAGKDAVIDSTPLIFRTDVNFLLELGASLPIAHGISDLIIS